MQNALRTLKKFKKSIKYFIESKYLQKTLGAVKFRGFAYCEFAYIEYRELRIIAVHNFPNKFEQSVLWNSVRIIFKPSLE